MRAWVALLLLVLPRTPARDRLDWRVQLERFEPRERDGRLVQPLDDGGRVELTLDPYLQKLAHGLLAQADAARGAAVVISVDSGRVLALAGRSRVEPERDDPRLALTGWAPAASVFKLATAAALLEAGVPPGERVCYHGGLHSVERDNLAADPRRDRRCADFAAGLARSQNAIIARLAHEHLDPLMLDRTARALGFGAAPAFDVALPATALGVPDEPLLFARTAAGFAHNTLSPLQGALLAAAIARGGDRPRARVVERVVDSAGGAPNREATSSYGGERVLDERIARALASMMLGTTESGTARKAFHDPRTRRRLLPITVAGKTGSLNGRDPFTAYSWFVGFAPADRPEVAFAVLLGHDEEGRVRAAEVARDLLAGWLAAPRGALLASAH
jgi:cell division protein FtsI/penicillin-binding protein 2